MKEIMFLLFIVLTQSFYRIFLVSSVVRQRVYFLYFVSCKVAPYSVYQIENCYIISLLFDRFSA